MNTNAGPSLITNRRVVTELNINVKSFASRNAIQKIVFLPSFGSSRAIHGCLAVAARPVRLG